MVQVGGPELKCLGMLVSYPSKCEEQILFHLLLTMSLSYESSMPPLLGVPKLRFTT